MIARLRAAGAVLVAKLAMVQLAGGGGYTNGCASLHGDLSGSRDAVSRERTAVQILSDPDATRTPVTGADGLTVSYTYDSFGRLASEDTPGVDTTFSYVAGCPCLISYDIYYVHAEHS